MPVWGQALDAAAHTRSDHAIVFGACCAALRARFAPTLLFVAGNPSSQSPMRSHRAIEAVMTALSKRHAKDNWKRTEHLLEGRLDWRDRKCRRHTNARASSDDRENPRKLDALVYTGYARC